MPSPLGTKRSSDALPNPARRQQWIVYVLCGCLAALVWAVFGQALGFDFVNFDDDLYVCDNPTVINGLSWKGAAWVFTHYDCKFFHPLTMLSLMLDSRLYGLNPGGFHFTSVLLHTFSTVLLFLVLRKMTGALWPSAFVAAIFAVHPLRAESVAWVAERKDTLSVFFFMLTLWAYVRYARGPNVHRFLAVVIIFVVGLLAKPSLMTLPFVMLLLDYWPLRRFRPPGAQAQGGSGPGQPPFPAATIWRLLLEKVPLLVFSVAAAVVAVFAEAEVVRPVSQYPIPARIGNALVSYATYLSQTIYPANLTAFYPHPGTHLPGNMIALSFVLLAVISALVFLHLRQRPYLVVGWLWFLGMLVPMIGLVQVGGFAHADRFTYLPQIGLFLAATWAVAHASAGWHHRQAVLGGAAAMVIVILATMSFAQVARWRNSDALWSHALACTRDNALAEACYSDVLLRRGDDQAAMDFAQKALAIEPDFEVPRNNLGVVLFQEGHVDEAITNYHLALATHPDYEPALYNLGKAMLQQGHADDAIACFQKAVKLKPTDAEAANNLGCALLQQGRTDDAIASFQDSLRFNPAYAAGLKNLGSAELQQGHLDDAIATFQKCASMWPSDAEAWYDLGNTWLQKRRGDDAIAAYQKSLALRADYPEAHYNLGSALLLKGSQDDAIAQYQQYLVKRPDDAGAHNQLGYALLQKGKAAESIGQFEMVLAINPNQAETHNNLGNALLLTGQLDQALLHFRQALALQPDYEDARSNLNRALLLKGK